MCLGLSFYFSISFEKYIINKKIFVGDLDVIFLPISLKLIIKWQGKRVPIGSFWGSGVGKENPRVVVVVCYILLRIYIVSVMCSSKMQQQKQLLFLEVKDVLI